MKFRTGDCAILALRLHELTELPLVGLFDSNGDLHHVAVAVGGDVLDIDGLTPMRKRAQQFWSTGRENVWRPVTEAEIEQRGLPGWDGYTDNELDEVDEEAIPLAQEVVSL